MSKSKKGTRASSGMGSIRQRADGRWEARYTGPDKRQRSVYGKTEKEVTAKLKAKLHEVDIGMWRMPSRLTVNDWLDTWLTDYQGHTTGRTVWTYRTYIKNYIRPVIGDVRLSDLKPHHIMHILAEMQSKNLSTTTQRQTCMVIKNALRSAITAGLITKNPADDIKLPKKPAKKIQFVDRYKIPGFIRAAKDTAYPNELLLMLYTGIRVGELRGLRWGDYDEAAATLSVERQLYSYAHGKGFGLPKYGEVRTIELPDEAVEVLHDQRKRQAEQRLAFSGMWVDDELTTDLIFRQPSGATHNNSSLERTVKRVGVAIGIPNLHPHDLRHSYAIAAICSGADIKTVQHNLGHKSAKVTLDTYAEYTTDAGRVSAKKFSEYLKNHD